jgi:hypothetical protein
MRSQIRVPRLRSRPDLAANALTVAVLLGALMLAYSEWTDLYRVVSSGGVVLDAPGAIRTGGDKHGYALVVVAVAAVAGVVLARVTGQPLPAWSIVALGAITLVVVLAVDLPDATSSGLTASRRELGEAEPAVGFWLELAAALTLMAAGTGLALLLRRTARSDARPRRGRARARYQR